MISPTRRSKALLCAAMILLAATAGTGCALYRDDRMWIPEDKADQAREIFRETQSLTETRTRLEALPNWRRPEINQAIYHLEKTELSK